MTTIQILLDSVQTIDGRRPRPTDKLGEDHGYDSLDVTDFVCDIERKTGKRIPSEISCVFGIITLEEIAECIDKIQ